MNCPEKECNSDKISKIGTRMTRRGRVQLYQCQVCGRRFQSSYISCVQKDGVDKQ